MKSRQIPAPPSDEAIIEMYFARDEQAIAETDRKYGTYLLRLCENILHDPAESEECRNDVYLQVWQSIPPERPTVLPAYLHRLTRCRAIDRYRARARRGETCSAFVASVEELADILPSPDTVPAEWESREMGREISRFLRSQSERRQYLFVARYFRAESVEDIAACLGVSPSAVYKELAKLRRGLKEHLERNGFSI